jgi:hypothetical protein
MIRNSLSSTFPRIQLDQGKLRAGLDVDTSPAKLKIERHRLNYHAWGTDSDGQRTNKDDCFISGSVYKDSGESPTAKGWRRDFDFALVDADKTRNLSVKLETGENPGLVINNQGREGGLKMKVQLDAIDKGIDIDEDGARLVCVKTDVNDHTGARKTEITVGAYTNDCDKYELTNGVLRML